MLSGWCFHFWRQCITWLMFSSGWLSTDAHKAPRCCRCRSTCCGMVWGVHRASHCSWASQRPSVQQRLPRLLQRWRLWTSCGTRRATWQKRWRSAAAPVPLTGRPYRNREAPCHPVGCVLASLRQWVRCSPYPGCGEHPSEVLRRFISLEEAPRLYAGLLTTRDGLDPWSVVAAAADGMAGILRRAQVWHYS